MKKVLYPLMICLLLFTSCKKELKEPVAVSQSSLNTIIAVDKYLHENLSTEDYRSLNFQRYLVSKQKSCEFIKIALKDKNTDQNYVLVQTDSIDIPIDGKIIHLEQHVTITTNNNNPASLARPYFNGTIAIISLNRKESFYSPVTNGFIELFHPQLFGRNAKASSHEGPFDELPEFVVVGYHNTATTSGGLTWADYMMLQSMFSGATGVGGGIGGSNGSSGNGNDNAVTYSFNGLYGGSASGPSGINNQGSWHTESEVDAIMTSLYALEASAAGIEIAKKLKTKYWADTNYRQFLPPIDNIKNKSEVQQRFYISGGQTYISVDEAMRFLQNKWLERQMQNKRKRRVSSNTDAPEGTLRSPIRRKNLNQKAKNTKDPQP